MRVMKNVEAVGICVARVVAADPGLSANCWIELINPEARVTMKKVCYKQLLELQPSNVQQTYNNKKQEVSSHKVYLDFGPAWKTLKCRELYRWKASYCQRKNVNGINIYKLTTQDEWHQFHQERQQYRWQDTTNYTLKHLFPKAGTIDPCQPVILFREGRNIG